jgi:hypothetical protein
MKSSLAFFTIFLLCVCTASVRAQEQVYTLQDAVLLLENDFEKYPWAHLYYNRKIHDGGPESVKVMRQTYEQGEVIAMRITKSGWRYEVKLNFTSEKQAFAKRSYDIRYAVYQSINEILPKKDMANTTAAANTAD